MLVLSGIARATDAPADRSKTMLRTHRSRRHRAAAVAASVCASTAALVGAGFAGYTLPHHLSPTDRVAPRFEEVPDAVSTLTVFRTAPAEKLIALTFDDGPDPTWTPRFLEVLRESGAHATFFVVGSAVAQHPDLVRREIQEGHEVGIHEWAHVDVTTQAFAQLAGRLHDTTEAILAAGAPPPVLARPPYGRLDSPALRAYANEGLTAVLWSHHFPGAHAAAAAARNIASASPGMIVLAHDGRSDPTEELVEEVARFITRMQADGYRFVTVSELLDASAS